jgi:RNA polymerase sigma-70 factor (ECF subfamily)
VTAGQGDADVRDAVLAVRRGEDEAFAAIVDRFQRRLFGLALMITRDPASAEEIAQDALVRAFLNLGSYDLHRPFYPWLATIAVRLAQNWLVKHARTAGRESATLDDADAPAPDADPLATLIDDEADRAVWRAVSTLPSGERTAVLLYYRQEMSVAEIAAALGVSAGTVKTHLSRARVKLRHILEDTTIHA